MSKDNTYNPLLHKLLNGTITSEEKWELEKASLDDPFLTDAIEGYYDNEGSASHLTEIKEAIQPVKKKSKTRGLLIKRLSIAASLLALFTASFWMFQNTSSPNLTAEKKSAPKENPSADKSILGSSKTLSKQKRATKEAEIIIDNNTASKKTNQTQPNPNPQPTAIPLTPKAEPRPRPQVKDIASQGIEERLIKEEKSNSQPEEMDDVVITQYDEQLLSDAARRGNSNNEKTTEPTTNTKIEKARTTPNNEEILADTESEEETILAEAKTIQTGAIQTDVSQSMAIPPAVPTIRRGIVRDDKGTPLAGVTILDSKSNPIATTNAQGLFSLPDDLGYVMTSFMGYDSKTVPVTDQLTIELQPTANALSERHLRLIDQMNDTEVQRYYTNKLNELFSRNWPICRSGFSGTDIITNAGRPQQRFTRTHISVSIKINDGGIIEDLTYFEDIEPSCSATINDLFNEAMASGVFESGRAIEFRYRINL